MKDNLQKSNNKFVSNFDSSMSDMKGGADDLFDMVSDESFNINIERRTVRKTQGVSIYMRRHISFVAKK